MTEEAMEYPECDECDYQTHKNSIWGKDRCLNYMKPIKEAYPICRASIRTIIEEIAEATLD